MSKPQTLSMAPYFSLPFSCLFLLSLLFLSHGSHDQTRTGFEFLENLQGCQKGEDVEGLHELKQYLDHFGYLNYEKTEDDTPDANVFDDELEAAIRLYQLNHHIKPTGTLDSKTVTKMMIPRCGVPDIIDGTNRMRGGKKRHQHQHTGHPHYSFFEYSPRWPEGQTHLTYGFEPDVPDRAMKPIALAFHKWASASQYFTFSRTEDLGNADITIGFKSGHGDHGDGRPFDARPGIIAHAFAPTDGTLHFNEDRNWSVGPLQNSYDLETTALHEIGHLLGLDHSGVKDAIMYSGLTPGVTKGLHGDDVQGIKALYNVR